MSILLRYLNRELVGAVLLITFLLLLILVSNEFTHYLNRASLGKLNSSFLWCLILAEIPHLLAVLLPLGLFLGSLFVFGRLNSDREIIVLYSCGLNHRQLIILALPTILGVVLFVSCLSFWITPAALAYRDHLIEQTGSAIQVETTLPGRFQAAKGGQQVYYVQSLSSDHQTMKKIFIAQMQDPTNNSAITPWIITTAAQGYQAVNSRTGDRFFIALQGQRYEGIPGQKGFQMIHFSRYQQRIETKMADISLEEETWSTHLLWKAKKLEAISELQWRFSLPISALLLGLLAIPLSHTQVRQGKYAAFLPGILIYIAYANLLLLARNWLEEGALAPSLGLNWVHVLIGFSVLFAWWMQIGFKGLGSLFYENH